LTAGYGIQVSTSSQRNQAVGEQFKVPGELTSGAPDPPGYALNLTQVGGIEGKDSIRLPQLGLLNNDSFSLMGFWFGHCGYFGIIGVININKMKMIAMTTTVANTHITLS